MSAICQNTSLDSPIQNILTYEAFNHVKLILKQGKTKPRCRNGRIQSIAYDFLALNELIDLPDSPSSFTQNLSSYYLKFRTSDIPQKVHQEWKTIAGNGGIVAAMEMSILSHNTLAYKDLKSQIDRIESHDHFPILMKCYYWRWILEQLVVATSRPKAVTLKHGSRLNPHVNLLNPDSRNPIFSYNLSDNITIAAATTFLYIEDSETKNTWVASREHLLQLADTATQRYLTLLTSIFAEIIRDTSIPQPNLLIDVFEWGDDIINKFGNEAYKSIK